MSLCTVTWEMMNGKTVKCVYPFRYTPASYYEPEDYDAGEPKFYIEDEEVELENLPRGLDRIVDLMYEGSIGKSVTEERSNRDED